MLTPDYLKSMPDNIVSIFSNLEEQILSDISRRISKDLELTATADYQVKQLNKMGYNLKDIEKEISKATGLGRKEIEKMLKESSYLSYENDKKLYKAGSKILPKMNPKMSAFITATIKQTKGELENITNSLGVATNEGFKDLTSFYKDTLDYATFQLGSGAFDYNTVLKQAVKQLSDSGIRSIDYDNGYSSHVDVAVRRAVLTANSQITGYMSEQNADMMDQDLMEITSHSDSRPDHAEWQGQIVSRSGRRGYLSSDDIGYGSGGGFKGWNCRHDWFPYFEGISEPSKQVDIVDPIEYGDREYTPYEASQYQRSIERRMRKSKREIEVFKSAGLDYEAKIARIKLRRQSELYKDFSNKAGIRAKVERARIVK